MIFVSISPDVEEVEIDENKQLFGWINGGNVSCPVMTFIIKSLSKLRNIVPETLFPINVFHCFLGWANYETY